MTVPYTGLPNTMAVNGEYMFWWPHWQTIRDCLLGEIAIKARKTTYLPQGSKQTDAEYDAYLKRATFYNTTARTVAGLVGAIHCRQPLIEGVPAPMDVSNVTKDGQSFEMFMNRISREVVSIGRYGVMIDAPPAGEDGGPYFVGYAAEDIIDWMTVKQGSREKLTYVVLREVVRDRRPFDRLPSSEFVESYRILYIDEVDGIYKQRVYPDGNLAGVDFTETVPLMQGRVMTEIPFIFIGPYDFGCDIDKPPMLDIALMNLSHYRSYAELEHGRFYTAMPIYSVFLDGGSDDGVEYTVGPNTVWQLGSQDKVEIKEFTGSGLKFLENALAQKEAQIASLGGKLSGPQAGVAAESTDAVLQRLRGEATFLGSVIATLNEAGGRLLSALAMWNGYGAEVKVTYSSEATEIYLDGREIRAMAMLYDTGLMPLETIFVIFKQNNIIPKTVTLDEFKSMLPPIAPKVDNKIIEAEGRKAAEARYAAPIAEAQAGAQADAQMDVIEAQAEVNAGQTDQNGDPTDQNSQSGS